MNSRYTYKAKRKDNQEWVYGYYVCDNWVENPRHAIIPERDNPIDFELIEVEKETLCQCTGLQDIEGNYIFENDIVSVHNNPYHGSALIKYGTYKIKQFTKNQIEVEHLGFYLEYTEYDILSLGDMFTPAKTSLESTKSIKIIGNKFDNVKE